MDPENASMTRRFVRKSAHDSLSRRTFLEAAAFSVGSLAWAGLPRIVRSEERQSLALIPRERDPENLEFPFSSLDSFLTPNKLFYVRNHFAAPKLDANTWRLRVSGAVEK